MGEALLPLLVNPIVFFEECFTHMLMGESLFGMNGGSFTTSQVGLVTYALARGKVWIFVSAGCILSLSFLFMAIAAWKVNPLHSGSGRRRGKKNAA